MVMKEAKSALVPVRRRRPCPQVPPFERKRAGKVPNGPPTFQTRENPMTYPITLAMAGSWFPGLRKITCRFSFCAGGSPTYRRRPEYAIAIEGGFGLTFDYGEEETMEIEVCRAIRNRGQLCRQEESWTHNLLLWMPMVPILYPCWVSPCPVCIPAGDWNGL